MVQNKYSLLTALLSGIATAMVAGPVLAQEAGSADTALEEIVVTSQKREQKLQDVPIAVSVVSAKMVDAAGGFNVDGLRSMVPSLNIRKTNTSLNQALFLRGVGTINFAIAAQPSVAAVVDGVVLNSAGEAFGDLYDIERVEVLRGPQGTLFGKNSSAGVVNIVSRRPGDELGGYVDIGFYEDNERKVKASLDAPISENLHTRTTVTWGQFDGYIDNITATGAGGKVNGYDRKGIRTIWEATPNDRVRLSFIGDYRESDDNCCAEIIGTAPTGANGPALASLLAGVSFLGDSTRQVKQNLKMRSTEKAWGASVQADIDFDKFTLTSISAYRTWDATEYREGDWLDRSAAYVGNSFAQLHDFGPQTQNTLSEELRITSRGGGFVDFVGGLYYSKNEAERFFRRDDIVCTATTSPVNATGLAPCLAGTSTLTTPSASALFGADFKNFAVYADGTFHLSERVRGILGLRWTQDKLSFNHTYNFSPIAGPGIRNQTGGGTAFLSGSNSSSNVSGRAGFQFDVSDDVKAYMTYAKGYKGPAYNVFFNMSANNAQVLAAETGNSVEVGVKSTLFDGRMLLNTAAFWARYNNFQANNFLFLNGTLITTLTNAGEVSSGGLEVEMQAKPSDRLSVSAGFTYNDARVRNWFTPAGSTPQIKNGSALPLAPKYKGSANIEYTIPVGRFELAPSVSVSYQDESWADLNEPVALRIPGYTTTDLMITLRDPDNKFRVSLIGRNIGDQTYSVLRTGGGPGGAPRLQIPRDADRYFGIQARFNFGAK